METQIKPPSILYKYVGMAGKKILQTKSLRFTRPSLLNDPFEVRPFLKTIGTESDWFQQIEQSLPTALDNSLKSLPESMVKSFSSEDLKVLAESQKPLALAAMRQVIGSLAPAMNTEFYKQADERLGILSLTENANDLLMWSHYGDFHRGMVLGFSSGHGFFERRRSHSDEFYWLRKVAYSHLRPHVDLLRTISMELFLTKSKAWEYEAEWRMMTPIRECKEVDTGIHVQTFAPECLRTVILGANSSQDFKDEVSKIISEDGHFSHVRVLFAELHEQEYALKFSRPVSRSDA